MIRMLLGILILAFTAAVSFADEVCLSPNNYRELIACAEARSPEIQSVKAELEAAQRRVDAAGQWRNPEFALETFRGKVGGDSRAETDLSLGVPLEIGGKISARKTFASGAATLVEARLFEARAKVRSATLLKLHRLRQVLHEREIIDEAVGTFAKLIGRYSQRPGLSPEQQVSSSVFQLSKGDYELKRTTNSDEQLALESYFKLNLGLDLARVKSILPETPKRWPAFSSPGNPAPSAKQRLLQAEVAAAKGELEIAKSEAWPTLTVGPSVKLVEESKTSDQLVGFNLSFPLPVFNVNGGGRAAAAAGVKTTEMRMQHGLREQQLLREELAKMYEQSVKALTSSLSHAEIEKRHEESEKLFVRGVIPSALVIEAHRTSFELEKTRHERELKALEALLGLYAIDGTLLENQL